MNELLEQFLIEARELAEQATDDLLALEQAPDDRARLDGAFRGFHTLKGAAGIVEFSAMGRIVHAAEDLLAAVRDGDDPLTADLIGNCLACLDQIVRWLDAMEIERGPPPGAELAAAGLVARFALPGGPHVVTAPAASATNARPSWIDALLANAPGGSAARIAVRYVPDADCFYRGEDPLAFMGRLTGLLALRIEPRQPWPPLSELDPFACNLVIEALSSGSAKEVADHLGALRGQVETYTLWEHILSDRAAEILRAQIALVSGPPGEDAAARLASAGRVAGNVLRHLGLSAEATNVDAAAADPGAFVAALDAILNAPAGSAQAGLEALSNKPRLARRRRPHVRSMSMSSASTRS